MLFGKTYVRIFVFKMLITHRTISIGNRRAANFSLFNYVDSVRLQEPSTKVTQFGSFLQHKRPIYLSHLHWPLMTIQMSVSPSNAKLKKSKESRLETVGTCVAEETKRERFRLSTEKNQMKCVHKILMISCTAVNAIKRRR